MTWLRVFWFGWCIYVFLRSVDGFLNFPGCILVDFTSIFWYFNYRFVGIKVGAHHRNLIVIDVFCGFIGVCCWNYNAGKGQWSMKKGWTNHVILSMASLMLLVNHQQEVFWALQFFEFGQASGQDTYPVGVHIFKMDDFKRMDSVGLRMMGKAKAASYN